MEVFFAAAGVSKEYVEDMVIKGAGSRSSADMVSFERAIREGYFAVCSADVKRLPGRLACSLREVLVAPRDLLRKAGTGGVIVLSAAL